MLDTSAKRLEGYQDEVEFDFGVMVGPQELWRKQVIYLTVCGTRGPKYQDITH